MWSEKYYTDCLQNKNDFYLVSQMTFFFFFPIDSHNQDKERQPLSWTKFKTFLKTEKNAEEHPLEPT